MTIWVWLKCIRIKWFSVYLPYRSHICHSPPFCDMQYTLHIAVTTSYGSTINLQFQTLYIHMFITFYYFFLFQTLYTLHQEWGGGGIAQSLASLSTRRAVRDRSPLNPLVSERWNSISVLLIRSHQCWRLVQKRPSMCYYVCVIMHVKDP